MPWPWFHFWGQNKMLWEKSNSGENWSFTAYNSRWQSTTVVKSRQELQAANHMTPSQEQRKVNAFKLAYLCMCVQHHVFTLTKFRTACLRNGAIYNGQSLPTSVKMIPHRHAHGSTQWLRPLIDMPRGQPNYYDPSKTCPQVNPMTTIPHKHTHGSTQWLRSLIDITTGQPNDYDLSQTCLQATIQRLLPLTETLPRWLQVISLKMKVTISAYHPKRIPTL